MANSIDTVIAVVFLEGRHLCQDAYNSLAALLLYQSILHLIILLNIMRNVYS